jgi:hypothetical protein
MGGLGSGRWARGNRRQTLDDVLQLDVRRLSRQGCSVRAKAERSPGTPTARRRAVFATPALSVPWSLDTDGAHPHQTEPPLIQ